MIVDVFYNVGVIHLSSKSTFKWTSQNLKALKNTCRCLSQAFIKHMKKKHESLSRSVVFRSLRPCGLQPSKFLCPWDSPGQEYWSGLPCPPPRDLPDPRIEPSSPALQADSLPSEPYNFCLITHWLAENISVIFFFLPGTQRARVVEWRLKLRVSDFSLASMDHSIMYGHVYHLAPELWQ